MDINTAVGKNIPRIDAWDKVTGRAQYTDDLPGAGLLCARILTSTHAHARIVKIDTSKALALKGVKAILTGADLPELFGPLVLDRPALARDLVRYAGEPVALAVAVDEPTAEAAVRLIEVQYDPLPAVLTPSEALKEGAPLVHQKTNGYEKIVPDVYPEAGTAVARAADDLIAQLKTNGAQALNCSPDDIEVAYGRVFSKKNPELFIAFKDIVHGCKSTQNQSIGEPALGRGAFMLKGLSLLDPQTGQGKTGPSWTVGAQAVEIEADLKTYTYRILKAFTVLDVGKALNPELMRAVISGGMSMGLSLASREALAWDISGVPARPNLRTYKLMHIGQEPDYAVGFVETPEEGTPYGVRSHAEHGIIGMPAALSNALSAAFGHDFTALPLTPENIWRACREENA